MPRRTLAFLVTVLAACGAPATPAPKSDAVEWMPFDTGSTCAKAEVACGPGNCAARIDNRCGAPLSCELTVQCVCQALTGESGEARSHAKDTAPAGGQVGLRAFAICSDGEVVATLAESVRCK